MEAPLSPIVALLVQLHVLVAAVVVGRIAEHFPPERDGSWRRRLSLHIQATPHDVAETIAHSLPVRTHLAQSSEAVQPTYQVHAQATDDGDLDQARLVIAARPEATYIPPR